MRKLPAVLLIILVLTLSLPLACAQDGSTPTPTVTPTLTLFPTPTPDATGVPQLPPVPKYHYLGISTEATTGLTLYGDLYLIDAARPTILLLHQMYTDRSSWNPVWPGLLAGGYNVAAVDIRGHGATGSLVDWDQALIDVQTWLDWLRANNLPDVVTMGSSMGSSLAIAGCALDAACLGTIGISPGWNYYEISVQPAFAYGLAARPALLVLARDDPWPMRGVPRMVEAATNPVTVQEFPGNLHGMDLFRTQSDLLPLIVQWLWANIG